MTNQLESNEVVNQVCAQVINNNLQLGKLRIPQNNNARGINVSLSEADKHPNYVQELANIFGKANILNTKGRCVIIVDGLEPEACDP